MRRALIRGGIADMRTIAKLRTNPRVEIVDDERNLGNGVIVTLRRGWTFSFGEDNRVRGEDTLHEIWIAVRDATEHKGPFDT